MFLILEPELFPPAGIKRLERIGRVYTQIPPKLSDRVEIQVIFLRLAHYIDRDFIAAFPRLRLLATATTGQDHICESVKSTVNLISLRGEVSFLQSIPATAEFTITLMMSSLKKLKNIFLSDTSYLSRDSFISSNMAGKNVLIVGLGRVGSQVASYATALGAKVFYIDHHVENSEYIKVDWNADLAFIDILTIHLSHNSSSSKVIDKKFLSRMPNLRVFVNTARGEVVNEKDLLEFINENPACDFVLDVVSNEQKGESFLRKSECNNLTITPHVAGNSLDSRQSVEAFMVDKTIAWLSDNQT